MLNHVQLLEQKVTELINLVNELRFENQALRNQIEHHLAQDNKDEEAGTSPAQKNTQKKNRTSSPTLDLLDSNPIDSQSN